jgi:hypothetical protein
MIRKFFIVDPANERLYRSLRATLAEEVDVEIFYDRRSAARASRWRGAERRKAADLRERIRNDGFVVARPVPPAEREGNIRWTA